MMMMEYYSSIYSGVFSKEFANLLRRLHPAELSSVANIRRFCEEAHFWEEVTKP